MKVIFHEDFYKVYTSDPAASEGRMESIMNVIEGEVEIVTAEPANMEDIKAVHDTAHIESVRRRKLYDISALAAGGAAQAARIGLTEPCFALIRPPGHHASRQSSWGFCYFNNMAVAVEKLKNENRIETAYVLDIDLHYGDGNANILEGKDYVKVYNVSAYNRVAYLEEVENEMKKCTADIIGISAGFDNHKKDWGGVLETDDYMEIGRLVLSAAQKNNGGCFAILEGGYNHRVLGYNVQALIRGLSGE